MPTEARNAEQEMMGVEGATNGFHDHQLPDSPMSHDDGYFTSAVSVQHKFCTASPLVSETTTTTTHNTAEHHEKMSTASSVSSTELDHYGRKVVWPCNNNHHHRENNNSLKITSRSDHHPKANLNGVGMSVDKPMAWMKHAGEYPRDANEELEMDIQKTTFAVAHSNRLSRSRSRHIMDRAKSFERAAAEAAAGGLTSGVVHAASGYNSNTSSRPVSRSGSVSRNRRSPSVGRQLADQWQAQVERNSRSQSRTRERHPSVGRVDTKAWEQPCKTLEQQQPAKTPPPKRRELPAPSAIPRDESQAVQFPRGNVLDMLGQWPPSRPETPAAALEPNRPSSRMKLRTTGFEESPLPPPVPMRSTYPANTVREDNVDVAHHLNRASIQLLSEQADESKEQIVEEWVRQTTEQYNTEQTMESSEDAKVEETTKNLELEKFAKDVAESVVTNMEKHGTINLSSSNQMNKVSSTEAHCHEERTIHEQRQFQQQSFSSKRSETNQDHQQQHEGEDGGKPKNISGMFKAKPAQTSQHKDHVITTKRKQDEEQWRLQKMQEQEEKKKVEELETIQINEELKKQRKEEQKRKNEEKEREMQRQKLEEEESRRKEAEIRRMEDLKRREKIKKEHEKRLEMEKMKLEELQRAPRILRKDSFKAINNSTTALQMKKPTESPVRTGHVHDKRSFWMRSTENLNARHEMSPGPRRRRLIGQDWIRSENTPEPISRPGSSLGQAMAGSGSNVKHTAKNWSTLSKSKSSAAVLLQSSQNELPPPRPRSRNDQSIKNMSSNWAKKDVNEERRGRFEEAETHQVQDTLSEWGKDDSFNHSGRNTPNPTRNISEKFADSKIGTETWRNVTEKKEGSVTDHGVSSTKISSERVRHKSGSTPWRTKTPEPGLKILNVSVESPHGCNVHISQNAEAQMASFVQTEQQMVEQNEEEKMEHTRSSQVEVNKTMSSSSSTSVTSLSTTSATQSQQLHQHQETHQKYAEQKNMEAQQTKFEEQEKRRRQELQKKQEEERTRVAVEETKKKEELKKNQEEQYRIEKKKAQKAFEAQKQVEEQKRQEETRKREEQQRKEQKERELETQRALEEQRKLENMKREQEEEERLRRQQMTLKEEELERLRRQQLEQQVEEEAKNRQMELEKQKEKEEQLRKQQLEEEEERKKQQKPVEPPQLHSQMHPPKPSPPQAQKPHQQAQYLRQFHQIEPRVGAAQFHHSSGISTQVSSHLGGSTQYLQTSERVTSVPPRSPALTPKSSTRADRGKSSTPERSKLIIRAEPSPPPETVQSKEGPNNTETCSELGSTTSQEHSKVIPNSQILSHSSGEVSGGEPQPMTTQQRMDLQNEIEKKSNTITTSTLVTNMFQKVDSKQEKHDKAAATEENVISIKSERGDSSTPLPVLSEWLNEDILKRKQQHEEKEESMKIKEQKMMEETKQLERIQQEMEQKQKLLEEQKARQQQMFKTMEKESMRVVKDFENKTVLEVELKDDKQEREGMKKEQQENVEFQVYEEIKHVDKNEELRVNEIISIECVDVTGIQDIQAEDTREVSEELRLREELMKVAKDKQQKGKRDKKKTNVYTTEELELIQKKRLEEYRKAQQAEQIVMETGSVHTEHSAQDQTGEQEELQQDIFLKKLKEEKFNEQKLLEEAIKGKVRGNIKMFQQAAEATKEDQKFVGGRKQESVQRQFKARTTSEEISEDDKTQREKELEAIALARANSNWEDGEEEREKEMVMREAKSRELQNVVLCRENVADNMWEDLTDAEERSIIEKEKRRQELEEISSTRSKTKWEEVVSRSTTSSFNPDLEALSKGNMRRDTAQVWQERQNVASAATSDQKNVPTRRIGNIFSHSPTQWKMDNDEEEEEFPAPPTQDEVDAANEMSTNVPVDNADEVFGIVEVTNEETIEHTTVEEVMISEPRDTNGSSNVPQPVPPPRESSKDYMREWSKEENSSVSCTQTLPNTQKE